MAARQVSVLYAVIATVVVGGAAAWLAGSRIESPSDVAARTAPPAPSPILVAVEERVLSSEIVTRGTVRFGFGAPQPIAIVPSPLKGGNGLITTVPLRGAQFKEGDVLLTVSGRPLFAFQGAVPTYRDLVPGSFGPDVRQLKEALERLGYDPGPVDAPFDERTSAAVARLYTAKGWQPFGPTREQLAALRALERDRDDALRSRLVAQTALASAIPAVASARATAEQMVRAASADFRTRIEEQRRLTEPGNGGEPLLLENERAKAEFADRSAAADLEAQINERALIVLDPRQPETARAAAEAKLNVARAGKRRTRLEGELALQTAVRETSLVAERVRAAEAALRAARLEGDKAIRAATDAQRIAEYDLRVATERANALSGEVDASKRKLGFQIPADEIVFIRLLPVRVEEVSAGIGASASGNVMSVTDNQLAVDSSLPVNAASLVKPGMAVAIEEQTLGIKTSGQVRFVASTPGTYGADGFHVHFDVLVDQTPTRLDGSSVRLRIPIQSTGGAVTAVPVSAVSLAADGTSRVQVSRNGTLTSVMVEVGLAAGGFVEVTPVGGALTAGELVVVGYKVSDGRVEK